jgi:hypothetical protein
MSQTVSCLSYIRRKDNLLMLMFKKVACYIVGEELELEPEPRKRRDAWRWRTEKKKKWNVSCYCMETFNMTCFTLAEKFLT